MKTVLLTGVTGFLGSHIAEAFHNSGYNIVAIKRQASNLTNCSSFIQDVHWVNSDTEAWQKEIVQHQPTIVIHAAWLGVGAKDRDNYSEQVTNLNFLAEILQIAKEVNARKFIALGSQAEYGLFSGKISETHPLHPNSAYGIVKTMCSTFIENFCTIHKMSWLWLRLFACFGEREGDNWFIPSVIKKVVSGESMDMTPGLQKYAYMYVKDLANNILTIAESGTVAPGIYNLSSNYSYTLKEVVEKIIELSHCANKVKVHYGAIPYRQNQPMQLEGDNKKLEKQIGLIKETGFEENLMKTIFFYMEKYKNGLQ